MGIVVAFAGEEVDDEGVFDGEDGVVVVVLVAAVEDLRDDGFVAGGGDLRGLPGESLVSWWVYGGESDWWWSLSLENKLGKKKKKKKKKERSALR